MIECKWCGNENEDGRSYCWYDGKPLNFDEKEESTRSSDSDAGN